MIAAIQTHAVISGLLDRWGIPPEGVIYAFQTKVRKHTSRGSVEVYDGFQWTHLESTTKISNQKGFATLSEAEAAAKDRAKIFGAIYTTALRSTATGRSSS
jgi:hypothetical protein